MYVILDKHFVVRNTVWSFRHYYILDSLPEISSQVPNEPSSLQIDDSTPHFFAISDMIGTIIVAALGSLQVVVGVVSLAQLKQATCDGSGPP